MSLLNQVEREMGLSPDGALALANTDDVRACSRRALFRGLKSIGALSAMWAGAAAMADPPREVSADVDPNALLNKLVRRITLGLNPAETTRAAQLGYSGYLEYQLNANAIDDSANESTLALLTTLTMTPLQLNPVADSQISNELTEATIRRSVFSQRQLFQRMVEFWTDHFNIDINKAPCTKLKTVDDRAVIRTHALGTFPVLLDASAHSPAMLGYLDNQLSTAAAPNENYAREIMELHTLGVDGGYTQQDVIEVAKCFSGWGFQPLRDTNPAAGEFLFTSSRHTSGTKTVLGNVITAGGINDGLAVLDILAHHPNTARFIAKKLCTWFLGDATRQSIINSVAATYTSTNGDLKAMIRTILKPEHLFDAALRYKRPYHHFVSALRALPTTITSTSTIRGLLGAAGHRPFFWATPDGYPDNIDYWVGYIIPRWNFGASLMNNNISGLSVNSTEFAGADTDANVLADKINIALFGGEMSTVDRNRVRDYMLPNPVSNLRLREGIGLAIGSPGFQWY